MRISFTGSRKGMSDLQKQRLRQVLEKLGSSVALFSHGCCIGADVEAHAIAREVCGPSLLIAAFPSTAKTVAPVPSDANFVAYPKSPLERDEDIVDVGHDLLIAAPLSMSEHGHSGTWHTVKYARKRGVEVLVLPRRLV